MALLLNVSLYLCDQGYLCDSQASVTFFSSLPTQSHLRNCVIAVSSSFLTLSPVEYQKVVWYLSECS